MISYPLYLVPNDFTEVSDNAMHMAMELAKANNGSIFMLHVVPDRKEKHSARKKMNEYIDGLDVEDQQRITGNVIVGNVYEDVGKASELLRPSLVVLGTHGATGLQNIFGSHMEKMITNSASPLLITRGPHSINDINNIVLPFNFTKESLQITSFACEMAKKFNACIHLVAEHASVEIHEEKVRNNQAIVKRYMEDNQVAYSIVNLPKNKSFDEELLEYSGQVNADIIAATYSNDSFLGTTDQHMKRIIENNYDIPILTYSSEEMSQAYSMQKY